MTYDVLLVIRANFSGSLWMQSTCHTPLRHLSYRDEANLQPPLSSSEAFLNLTVQNGGIVFKWWLLLGAECTFFRKFANGKRFFRRFDFQATLNNFRNEMRCWLLNLSMNATYGFNEIRQSVIVTPSSAFCPMHLCVQITLGSLCTGRVMNSDLNQSRLVCLWWNLDDRSALFFTYFNTQFNLDS